MKQAVRLFEFGTVERKIFTSGRVNCFQGEAMAAYDPCGNLISLVAQTTGAEVWARAVDKNSDATIGIYDPFNMEIPFSAQATINPSYDQPINGPIEFQIPEQGQWELKELLANLTKVNTTLGENGASASSSGDEDCPAGEGDCGDSVGSCDYDRCEILFENSDSTELKHDYEPSEYNCTLINCCRDLYFDAVDKFVEEHNYVDYTKYIDSYVDIPSESEESGYKEVNFMTAGGRWIYMDIWLDNHKWDCFDWLND